MRFASNKFVWIAVPGALAATILLAVVWYGPQAVLYFKYRRILRNPYMSRGLDSTPQPLTETGVSSAEGITLSYFGCHFEVPWKEVLLERNEGRWAEVRFKSGQAVRVVNPKGYSQENMISSYAAGDPDMYKRALQQGFPASHYEQFKDVISATPAQLSPFQSRQQFAQTLVLIGQKGLWFEHNSVAPEIFSFEVPNFRGFETSGISHNSQDVGITMFDLADHMFALRIQGDHARGANLSQAEINRVIQSFGVDHDLPSSPSKR